MFVEAVSRMTSLDSLRFEYKAQNGGNGEGTNRHGMKGKDTVIQVCIIGGSGHSLLGG